MAVPPSYRPLNTRRPTFLPARGPTTAGTPGRGVFWPERLPRYQAVRLKRSRPVGDRLVATALRNLPEPAEDVADSHVCLEVAPDEHGHDIHEVRHVDDIRQREERLVLAGPQRPARDNSRCGHLRRLVRLAEHRRWFLCVEVEHQMDPVALG